jgi:hypothetical protein
VHQHQARRAHQVIVGLGDVALLVAAMAPVAGEPFLEVVVDLQAARGQPVGDLLRRPHRY